MNKNSFNYSRTLIACIALIVITGKPLLGQSGHLYKKDSVIRVASCQFPVSDDLRENAKWIMDQMRCARDSGVQVAHFPECALSGYPGSDMKTLDGYDWQALHCHTDTILQLAKALEMWVILGSIHPLGGGLKPMNSLYIINPSGKIVERYDKRFCTGSDLKHFSAGGHCSIVEINGIRCGFLICYDVRFPELYREYRRLDADVIFQSFYNAHANQGSIHPKIMPVTAQARAATNYFFMSLTNSSAPRSWPCYFITPDGLVQDKLEADKPGILISDVDITEKYYDASRPYRDNSINGILSSGEVPQHPRYTDRTDH
jgi:predicted amidohydrolase